MHLNAGMVQRDLPMLVMGPMWVPNDGSLTLPVIGDLTSSHSLFPGIGILFFDNFLLGRDFLRLKILIFLI
jgi:hypothetical protein